ncbi:MAG: ATP-binding protein, partial [Betaproteobacteria bacterium]
MLKRIIEPVARGRFMLPLVIAFALLGVVVTETTYRGAKHTLDDGIALTDARVKSAALLQALTDHEIATHLYLLTGAAREAARQKATGLTVRRVQQEAFDLLRQRDAGGTVSLDAMRAHIDTQLGSFDAWRKLAADGQREDALRQSVGSNSLHVREDLRNEFDVLLQRTAADQQAARVSLYDALIRNRLAIHLLMVLTVLATMLFVRSLREVDRHKEEEKSRLAALVEESTSNLRQLAGHLVTAREDERARLARELHDEMGGLMTAMKLEFARLKRVAQMPELAGERLAAIDARLNEGIALKRRIVENLRPSSLDQLGLAGALELLCNDVADNLGVPVHTQLAPVQVAPEAELTIYRLVQESLTNISKYAECREVTVTLRPADAARVEMVITDDGQGFDAASVKVGRHGLLGMRFRVESHDGTLTIRSAPGAGTVVTAVLPAAR